jgi:superfamily II DNA or RNA helicase
MPTTKSYSALLERFYQYLEESDWLAGIDLYQGGKVLDVESHENLLLGLVSVPPQGKMEVRLKIHPERRCIQWMECTCRKNRAQNKICEHIAAVMIHLDRESPETLAKLDPQMPLRPPVGGKKPRANPDAVAMAGEEKARAVAVKGAAQTILAHSRGGIQGVALLAGGPNLRVRMELKPGHLTYYDLDLDAAADFIAAHPRLESASPEVRALQVYETPVEFGTWARQEDPERLVAERVIALSRGIRKPKDDEERAGALKGSAMARARRLAAGEETLRDEWWEFFPVKGASKYIGERWIFIPGRGWWPLRRDARFGAWADAPMTRTYKDDEAATLVRDRYETFLGYGTVWLDEALSETDVVDASSLTQVRVADESDGWFMLDPRYGQGLETVSMVELMKHWRKKRRKFMRSGKSWVRVPDFVTEHEWQLDESGNFLKVDALGLIRIKAGMGEFDGFVGSRKMLDTLRQRTEWVPLEDHPSLEHTRLSLRHYQSVGVNWLWWLYNNHLHGLLADEMGLGKTHEAMALMSILQSRAKRAKFMVVCPTTVLDHWLDKIERFCPNLRAMKYHGPKRESSLRAFQEEYDVMLTSYGVLLRDIADLEKMPWEVTILDEAHLVKNNNTSTYQSACRLRSRFRLCLTGTPMENHLGELKNIFDFLVPGYLGSDEYFRKQILSPLKQGGAVQVEHQLQRLIHPFKMRRTKDQVLPDLPPKVEDIRHCALSEEQVKLYREIVELKGRPLLAQMREEGQPVPYMHVFAVITMLKQLCDHPALISGRGAAAHESGKFEVLKELLEEALGSGHKVVVYSQYVGMIAMIEEYLRENAIPCAVLTGQSRDRGKIVARFQEDPECKVFVCSLLAGGVGIDLTAASVVIHFDRWWNASKENQATDRVHRFGQNKNVQVLKLVTRGTLEEKIDRMIASKRELFEKYMDHDEDVFKSMTRQELMELLQ